MEYWCSNEECSLEPINLIGDSDFFEDCGGHMESIETYKKDGKYICPYCESEIVNSDEVDND